MKRKLSVARNLLILLSFNFLITACDVFSGTQSSNGNGSTSTPPIITPSSCTDGSSNYPWLRVGNELSYVYKGTVKSDSMIVKVVSSPSAGSYKTEVRYPAASKTNIVYYHACGQDLYTSSNGNYQQYGHWWFSISVLVNDIWSRQVPGILYTYQLMSKNATAYTALRHQTFTNCYKFTGHDPFNSITDTIYFKPNTGIVYFSGTKETYELVRKNF